jgi:ABC-type nickel/cobalt efflux system permease component RcnA
MNPVDFAQHAGSNPWIFFLAALLLGALHGLEPGHSKGMMAAFIIGTRGTYSQAILLALCATLSHTAIVWILVWPASYGGAIWSATEITPYLNLISGIVIVALAYWMLRRLNRAHGHHHHHDHPEGEGHHHDHDRPHDHDHPHSHGHDHGPSHDDEHEHPHDHGHAVARDELSAALELEEDEHARFHLREIADKFSGHEVSTAQVAVFGLSSGLAPCTAAIVILIACFQLHQPWLGFALVAMFSLGLGLTLTSVALVASWGVRAAGAHSKVFRDIIQKAPFLSALVTGTVGVYLIIQFFRANY